MASAKIKMRVTPKKSFGCCALARTPEAETATIKQSNNIHNNNDQIK